MPAIPQKPRVLEMTNQAMNIHVLLDTPSGAPQSQGRRRENCTTDIHAITMPLMGLPGGPPTAPQPTQAHFIPDSTHPIPPHPTPPIPPHPPPPQWVGRQSNPPIPPHPPPKKTGRSTKYHPKCMDLYPIREHFYACKGRPCLLECLETPNSNFKNPVMLGQTMA